MKIKSIEHPIKQISLNSTKTVLFKRTRGGNWSKVRSRILKRDLWTCVVCGERAADEVDHIMPLHLGGKDNDENLQSICLECHAIKSSKETKTRGM